MFGDTRSGFEMCRGCQKSKGTKLNPKMSNQPYLLSLKCTSICVCARVRVCTQPWTSPAEVSVMSEG